MNDDTIAKAIIGTVRDVHAYKLPDTKGYSRRGMTSKLTRTIFYFPCEIIIFFNRKIVFSLSFRC